MANGDQTKKKPPAHEVIVTLLWQLADEWQREKAWQRDKAGAIHQEAQAAALERTRTCTEVLILVLAKMHVPEQERVSVADALRALPQECIPPMDLDHLCAEIEGDTGGA